MTYPLFEDVLPKYQKILKPKHPEENIGKAFPPDPWYYSQGARASMLGSSRCPWCDSSMTEQTNQVYLATCNKDSTHIVQWLCWPG